MLPDGFPQHHTRTRSHLVTKTQQGSTHLLLVLNRTSQLLDGFGLLAHIDGILILAVLLQFSLKLFRKGKQFSRGVNDILLALVVSPLGLLDHRSTRHAVLIIVIAWTGCLTGGSWRARTNWGQLLLCHRSDRRAQNKNRGHQKF